MKSLRDFSIVDNGEDPCLHFCYRIWRMEKDLKMTETAISFRYIFIGW